MKNLIWILAAIMLAGCGDNEEGQDMGLHGDPPGYSLFIWSNESDHRITMTVTDRFEKKEILPGESLLQEEVGFVTPPSLEGYMIDGVSIVFMGVKTKCTKEEQRQKDRYPVYIRRLAARHPRTHRETKCYFGDTFVLHLNQI
jgi:hypothetical protein